MNSKQAITWLCVENPKTSITICSSLSMYCKRQELQGEASEYSTNQISELHTNDLSTPLPERQCQSDHESKEESKSQTVSSFNSSSKSDRKTKIYVPSQPLNSYLILIVASNNLASGIPNNRNFLSICNLTEQPTQIGSDENNEMNDGEIASSKQFNN